MNNKIINNDCNYVKKKNEMCTEKYTALGYEVHAVFSKEKDINEDLQKMGG